MILTLSPLSSSSICDPFNGCNVSDAVKVVPLLCSKLFLETDPEVQAKRWLLQESSKVTAIWYGGRNWPFHLPE